VRPQKPKERKIHLALPEEVHQRLRVKCDLKDPTIQEHVSRPIPQDVQDIQLPVKTTAKRESRYA